MSLFKTPRGGPVQCRRRSFMAQPSPHPLTGIYYLRRKVPDELRPALGREFKRSLKTRERGEAKARFAAAWSESEQAFSAARAQLLGQPSIGPEEAEQLASRWFRAEQLKSERSGQFEAHLVCDAPKVVDRGDGCDLVPQCMSLREAQAQGDDWDVAERVGANVSKTLRQYLVPVPDRGSAAYALLGALFEEKLLNLSDWAMLRWRGQREAPGKGAVPFAAIGLERADNVPAKPAHRLSELFAEYSTRKKLNDGDTRSTKKTLAEFGAGLDDFIELYGDTDLNALGRDMIAQYRAALAKMPVKAKGVRGLTIQQRIAKAEKESLPRLSAPTIRNKLRGLSAVLTCGVDLGWMHENPAIAGGAAKAAARAAAKRPRGAGQRKHYTHAELAAIFTSPAFTETQWAPPRADFGGAWYWLPLLLYYTGARREELAQLAVADVRNDDAAGWFLSILEADDADSRRTVKTEGSRRQIPLHPALIEKGFITYVQGLPQEGPVFPRLQTDRRGFYGTNIGKRWAAYLRDMVQLDSPASPSHGFRHSFKTLCREVGIPEDVHDAITGHVGGRAVARGYGSMPLSRMAEEIRRFPVVPLGEPAATGRTAVNAMTG